MIKEIIYAWDGSVPKVEYVGELVRCKDCRHRASGRMGKMCYGRHPEDYCSYGERKESKL